MVVVRSLLPLALLAVLPVVGCHRPVESGEKAEPAPERAVIVVPRPAGNGPLAAALVVTVGERRFVVLDTHPENTHPEREEAIGPATLIESESNAATAIRATNAALSFRGRAVRLYGATGAACEGTLDAPALLARSSIETPPAVADEVWDRAGSRTLVAEVLGARTCGAVHWARDREFAEPAAAFAIEANDATRARAIEFVRSMPSYGEVQKRYVAEVRAPRPKQWDSFEHASPKVFTLTRPSENYAWVSMSAGPGCGEFGGSLAVLLREEGATFRVVHELAYVDRDPVALLGPAAEPTVLFREGRLRREGAEYELETVPVAWFGCGC